MKRWRTMGMAAAFAAMGTVAMADSPVHPDLPDYETVGGVSGSIVTMGSDTMNNLATLWVEGFISQYPNIQGEVNSQGSSTAPVGLTEGTATFGMMSRRMSNSEADRFEDERGYPALAIPVAVDMLAVYVHRDNPLEGLTIEQVDGIFSSTQRGGHNSITRWGDVGMGGEWANRNISLYGRNAASGTYGYFRDNALFGGDFREAVREQPGSSSVVQGVASERNAIGYSGIGYKTADVRAVPLKRSGDDRFYQASAEDADGYPLARFLWVYVNYEPGSELDPMRREFVRYIYSQQGQEAVLRDGFIPVSPAIARRGLEAAGIEPDF